MRCCVLGCTSTYVRKRKYHEFHGDQNVHSSYPMFHCFPNNPDVRADWISKVRIINGFNWQPRDSSFICSKHFDNCSWEKTREDGKRKLKLQAIPSIFQNLVAEPHNDHMYTKRTLMKNISNRSSVLLPDHTYVCQEVSSNNEDLSILAASSIEETSANTSPKISENNATVQVSNYNTNKNSEIVSSDSDIFIQYNQSEEKFSNFCIVPYIYKILPERIEKPENTIDTEILKKKIINDETMRLGKEIKQLKEDLLRVKKIANRICRQNVVLRNNNKKICQENRNLKNMLKRTEEGALKFLNKDQVRALSRKNCQGLKWEAQTLKQALIMRLKCGSSGYNEVRKYLPLPTLRTLQRNKI